MSSTLSGGLVGGRRTRAHRVRIARTFRRATLEFFVGRLTVYRFFVHPGHQRIGDEAFALLGRDRPNLATGGQHVDTLGHAGAAFFVQETHQGFAHGQLGDDCFNVQPWVGAHGAGCGFDGFLVAWGEGAQGVLHAVTQLGEHGVGNIERVLRHKINAHAFAAHQAHHEFNALDEHSRRFFEEQMRFVKEENELGFFQVAHLGQLFKEFRQHPQQEGGIEARAVHQLVGGQDVDHTPAAFGLHEVGNVEHGLTKETIAALFFNLQQATLNRAHAGRADIAVFGGELAGVLAHVLQHGAQVFQVEQRQAVVVGNFEHHLQHALLGFVQRQHAGQ